MINIKDIKELRNRTNISLDLCKKALLEAGTIEEAIVLLQKWGELRSAKAAQNEAREGLIYSYTHHNGKTACLVEINCQTDFASRSSEFKTFCENVALQIAATNPKYLSVNDIPDAVIEKQKEICLAQIPEKMPEDKRPHILNGKLKKWFGEVCLVDQKSVIESGKTVEQLRAELVTKISENVVIRRFVNWTIGE